MFNDDAEILERELNKKIAEASNKQLLESCARAALPDGKEAIVAVSAELVLSAIGVGVGLDLAKAALAVVGSAAVYGGVRSGVMAHREWRELAKRVLSLKGNKRDEIPVQEGVTPLVSTPKLVEQAQSLQGRRI